MSDKKILYYDPMTGEPVYANDEPEAETATAAKPAEKTNDTADSQSGSGINPDLIYKPVDPTMGDMINALHDVMPDLFDDNMSTAMPLPESSAAVTARAFREAQQQNLEAKSQDADEKTAPVENVEPVTAHSPYAQSDVQNSEQMQHDDAADGDEPEDTETRVVRPRRQSRAAAQHVLQLPKAYTNGDYAPHDCAGFYIRLAAFAVDSIISGSAALIIKSLLKLVLADVMGEYVLFNITLGSVISYLLVTTYFVVLTSCCGMTLGKRLLRICVVSVDGKELRFWQVLYRETIGRYLSSILCIGYIVLACDSRHRGFHDMLADTRVVYCR